MNISEVVEHFIIIVDRVNKLKYNECPDRNNRAAFSDKLNDIISLEKKVASSLKSVLNLAVEIELAENGSLPGSWASQKRLSIIERYNHFNLKLSLKFKVGYFKTKPINKGYLNGR